MKKQKRLLSLLLTLCMALSMLPGTAFASEGPEADAVPDAGITGPAPALSEDQLGELGQQEDAAPGLSDSQLEEPGRQEDAEPGLSPDELGELGQLVGDPVSSTGPVIIDFNPPTAFASLEETETTASSNARYTVLVLDCSGSMSGTPMSSMLQAAQLFCTSVMNARGENFVAIVPFDTSVGTVTSFTNDGAVLRSAVNALGAGGGTNLNAALEKAGELLTGVTGTKNILVLSDGLPEYGETSQTGNSSVTYTSADSSFYAYANKCLQTAENELWPEYNVYTLGFLHGMSGAQKNFCARFLDDLQNTLYVEITDPNDLQFVFDDIADEITDDTAADTDPIIVIPGIMGSRFYDNDTVFDTAARIWEPVQTASGSWDIDSLSGQLAMSKTVYVRPCENQNAEGVTEQDREYGTWNTYKDLIDRLCTTFPERPVYFFSYDWRMSSELNANALSVEIDRILTETNMDKVDLVCHSMGGLVASSYYSQYGSSNNKVDKIVTCGTPYEGAPVVINRVQNWNARAKKYGFNMNRWPDFMTGIWGGISNPVKSSFNGVAELTPTKNYLSAIPMWRDSWLPFNRRGSKLTYNDYVEVCDKIFKDAGFGSAVDFQNSVLGSSGYNALLNYPDSYFLIGSNYDTVTAVKFQYNSEAIDNLLYETDLRYDKRGDGIVPYQSASISRQIDHLDKSRWMAYPENHNGVVQNRSCLNWISNVLRNGRGISASLPDPSDLVVIRIACPVDVTVSNGRETLDSSSGSASADFGRMDILGENDEIKMFCLNADERYELSVDVNEDFKEDDKMSVAVRYYDCDGFFAEERIPEGGDITLSKDMTISANINNEDDITLDVNHGEQAISLVKNEDPSDFVTQDPPPFKIETKESSDESSLVSVPSTDHGEVIASARYAEQGDRVTLSTYPASGYKLDSITVTNVRGREISLRDLGSGEYSFTMPSSRVTVEARFVREDGTDGTIDTTPLPGTNHTTQAPDDEIFTGLGTPGISGIVLNPANMSFSDIRSTDWFYDSVEYVWKHYLMSGVSDTQFAPNVTTSRAMIWTVLARMSNVRTDVNPGATWYESGMIWAMQQGVTDGTNAMGNITREQLATMLWRRAGSPGVQVDLSQFSDSGSISAYAQSAVRWAVANGVLKGASGKLDPQGTATRAQVAAMVMRYGDRIGI